MIASRVAVEIMAEGAREICGCYSLPRLAFSATAIAWILTARRDVQDQGGSAGHALPPR
jgi:hypothetical protein